jgi:toxin ParE1/3/4
MQVVGRFPAAGQAGRVPGNRELIVPGTSYIIPYRVDGLYVDVLAVFHAAQDRPLE